MSLLPVSSHCMMTLKTAVSRLLCIVLNALPRIGFLPNETFHHGSYKYDLEHCRVKKKLDGKSLSLFSLPDQFGNSLQVGTSEGKTENEIKIKLGSANLKVNSCHIPCIVTIILLLN